MSGISVYLFGAPRLERDGNPLPLGRSKALALLAYLCISGGPHEREWLLEFLWPSFAPSDARNNLRRELSLLKGLLPEGLLPADRRSIGIDTAAFEDGRLLVDIHAFDNAINRARSHSHGDGPGCESCAALLESAVAIYTQDFLAGFTLPDSPAFDEWQFHQSERLRSALGWALGQLAEWRRADGARDQALEHARRWASLDPLNEEAHRLLMRLYAESSRPAAAMRQYEILQRALQDAFARPPAGALRRAGEPRSGSDRPPVEPEPETVQLYETIRDRRAQPNRADAPATDRPRKTDRPTDPVIGDNLPADTTPFIGRRQELARLRELMTQPTSRLITILGIGGMGKTRLALAAARRVVEAADEMLFVDGVFFVPLAPLTQASQLPAAMALGLGFTPGGDGDSAQQVIAYLKSRRALLLVDNLEHLISDESIAFLSSLMGSAPNVRLLVTSRTRLGLSGEQVFPLDGLGVGAASTPMPDSSAPETTPPDETIADAVALFTEAARRVQPAFVVNAGNREAITRICSLVEGMPLAIELAAGWVELLTPDAILEEISRSLDFLASPHADTPARQANLRAVFDSSWRMLTPDDQGALACLAVFPGDFNREAAEAIAGAPIKILLTLTNKSWLQSAGPNRYRIHPLLRQYAAREATPSGALDGLRDRHADYFVGLMTAQDELMRGRQPYTAFDTLAADLDNIRAAMMWLIGNDRLDPVTDRMARPLFRYLESRHHYFLFEPLFAEAIRRALTCELRRATSILLTMQAAFVFNGYPTRLLDYYWIGPDVSDAMQTAWDLMPADSPPDFWHILLAWQYGRFVEEGAAVSRLAELLDRLQEPDHAWERAFAFQSLGRVLSRHPGPTNHADEPMSDAREHLAAALRLFEMLGDEREAAITTFFLGLERQSAGVLSEARSLLLVAQERFRILGEEIIAAGVNWQLGEIYMQLGETENSLRSFHEMADAFLRYGRLQSAVAGLSRESYETVRYGDPAHALKLREQCLALSRQAGDHFIEAWDCWEMGEVYRVMGQYEPARHWFELSRKLFHDRDSDAGDSFYYRGLADLALAEGELATAESHYRQAIEWAEQTGHPWQHTYALAGLAMAELAGHRIIEAAAHLVEALRLARDRNETGGLALMTMTRAGQLLRHLGREERAAELARLALLHSLTWNETRDEAHRLLEEVREEQFKHTKTTVFDLATPIAQLIVELSSAQPGSPAGTPT